MTFVEKQMAVQLLSRRDWTWPEIFQFLELVTQKPLETDERKSLQDRKDDKPKKIFHSEQPIMLIAIADTVFDQVNNAYLEPGYFASDKEYFKTREAFREAFDVWAETMAANDNEFRALVTSDATKARDLLHIQCRSFMKDWWLRFSGQRIG